MRAKCERIRSHVRAVRRLLRRNDYFVRGGNVRGGEIEPSIDATDLRPVDDAGLAGFGGCGFENAGRVDESVGGFDTRGVRGFGVRGACGMPPTAAARERRGLETKLSSAVMTA